MFVGLDNYIALVGDEQFRTGVVNSFVFTAYAEVFKVVLGLSAALLLHHRRRGRAVLAGLLLLPWVVPTVVTAFSWRSLLDPIFGSVNTLLTESGIGPLLAERTWSTAGPRLAVRPVAGHAVGDPRQRVEGGAVLHRRVPRGVEGHPGGPVRGGDHRRRLAWQRFVHVTLPGLRHVIDRDGDPVVDLDVQQLRPHLVADAGRPGDVTAPYVLVAYSKAILQLQFGAGRRSRS